MFGHGYFGSGYFGSGYFGPADGAVASVRGRRHRSYKTRVAQESDTGVLPVIDLVLPPRDESVVSYITGVRTAAEFAERETRKILDYMEREDRDKKRRRRTAAYLLLN